MENIEKMLRNAFKAGVARGSHLSYFDKPLDEDEYIKSLKLRSPSVYYCSVCGITPVDAENGYDTCSDCINKI